MINQRWFTCTPRDYEGGDLFFSRDSGLLCRGFQALGVASHAVMCGPPRPDDHADLIRTNLENLESSEWWRSCNLDGVVLYAWGRPRYRKVAAAIRNAGVFLVLSQDNGGLVSPLAGFRDWLHEQWILSGQGRGFGAKLRYIMLIFRGMSTGILLTDPLRADHLKNGNLITCVSPKAAGYYRKICRIYGGLDLARRVEVVPHAVEPRFRHEGRKKSRQIACVGRWEDEIQKRPWLMTRVIGSLLESDKSIVFAIMGTTTASLEMWHRGLPTDARARVKIVGQVERIEVAAALAESMIFYSPSAFESFGIAAAEALCSGCSVVAEQSVSMVAFQWFVANNSGTLSKNDTIQEHVDALRLELEAWDNGARDASRISELWCSRLHAENVARRILGLIRHSNKAILPDEVTL